MQRPFYAISTPLYPSIAITNTFSNSFFFFACRKKREKKKERKIREMAKLAITTAVLVALFLAVAEVSCFRTIVTTTIEEGEQQGRGERQEQICRQQIQQKFGQLQSCRSYLQPSGSPFELDMVVNQKHQQGQEEQLQRQCCQPLKELGDCSCPAVQQIVEEQVQRIIRQGQKGQEQLGLQQQMQQILERARDIPRECDLRQKCEIQIPFNYYNY